MAEPITITKEEREADRPDDSGQFDDAMLINIIAESVESMTRYPIHQRDVRWLIGKLRSAEAQIAERDKRIALFCEDATEGIECLSACDSYGHDPACPLAYPFVAFRRLRERIAELTSLLHDMEAGHAETVAELNEAARRIAELTAENERLRGCRS